MSISPKNTFCRSIFILTFYFQTLIHIQKPAGGIKLARIIYGKTFWGEYFLKGLNSLYGDAKRIARGKNYASSGRVVSFEIKKNKIISKIKGNYRPFYKVILEFKPFSETQKKKIFKIIDENPLILAAIIDGKLPPVLLDKLIEQKIFLFPKNFEELKRDCNCPDWGDPCKHVAGTYFVLTNMIDNNPFVLFEIRGIDLINHYQIKQITEIEYPFSLVFEKNSPKTKDIDIVKLENFSPFILSRLEENPAFSSIDFKKVLDDFYKYNTKFIPTIIYKKQDEQIDKIERIFKQAEFKIHIQKDLQNYSIKIEHPILTKKKFKELFNQENLDLLGLIRLFLSFETSRGTKSYIYLYYFSRIIYLLAINNGFIFDILKQDNKFISIAKPLLSPLNIKKQFELLNEITPNIVFVENKPLQNNSANILLSSLFLTTLVQKLNFPMKKGKGDRIFEQIFALMFKGAKIKPNFELENVIKNIDKYFAIFDLLKSDIDFVIHIKEKDDNFTMEFFAGGEHICKIKNKDKRLLVYKLIVKFSDTLFEIEDLTKQEQIEIDFKRLEKFILEQKDILQDLGIKVIIPKNLQNLLKPKLQVKARSIGNLTSFLSLSKLLEFNFVISIGDREISEEELKKLLEQGRKIVKFKDSFVYLEPNEVKNLFAQLEKQRKLSKYDLLKLKFNQEVELDKSLDAFLTNLFTVKDFPLPDIRASLREYQKNGFRWAVNNLLNGFGVILADDMGLGKTLQTLTVISFLKSQNHIKKPALIVVPTTLLNNWAKEIDKFTPHLGYSFYYGQKRRLQKTDLILTTYDILRRDLEKLKKEKFDMLVIDEAQKIKNPFAATTLAVKSIKTKFKMALSGTPVENNLSELWSIFDFAIPRYLKSLKEFQKTFAEEIEIKKNKEVARKLKNITSPFMLRRLKTDKNIIADLPEKIVIDDYVSLTKEQAGLYQSYVDEAMDILKNSEDSNRRGLIFKLLIALKQICNHPKNFDKTLPIDYKTSGKTMRLLELLETILARDEKVLIFTQYTQMGDILEQIIKKELLIEPLYLKGSLSKTKRDKMIEEFNTKREKSIFILSLKAGGVGLNLTSANNVIHYDLWFNPAVENQATDRAFRIGQMKNVNVFRFITKGTFEEKIDRIIKAKQELQELTVSTGEKWIANMSNEELQEIFEAG